MKTKCLHGNRKQSVFLTFQLIHRSSARMKSTLILIPVPLLVKLLVSVKIVKMLVAVLVFIPAGMLVFFNQ